MSQFPFFVDETKCVKCGACLRDCVAEILEFDRERGFPRVIPGRENFCTHCQHCLAICPVGALEIFGRDPKDSLPPNPNPDPEALLSLIANRRSFRRYRHENLDPVTLDKLKDMLKFVPTGVNSHSLYFAFVDEVKVMDEFRQIVSAGIAAMFQKEPLPPFLAGLARYQEQLRSGKDVIFRGAPHMLVAAAKEDSPTPAVDPMIALAYFELYAQSLGVGTVWCGLALAALCEFPELMEKLQLPAGYRAGYCMLFGPTNLRYHRAVQPDPVRIASVRKESE